MPWNLCSYQQHTAWKQENEYLRVIVLPDKGANLTSLFYKPQEFEVWYQPKQPLGFPEYGADFSAFEPAGADEMYPTIDACPYPFAPAGVQLPDHGELWPISWECRPEGERLYCQAQGRKLSYTFSRWLHLEQADLILEYEVENTGTQPLYGLWAFHGLVACDADSQLDLTGADRIENVHDSVRLGSAGTRHHFPLVQLPEQELDLRNIRPASCQNTEKFYVDGPHVSGTAALSLNRGRLEYRLFFPEQVPYLGVWINEGGFNNSYNCALEPATAYYDNLPAAQKRGSLSPLAPGARQNWWLRVQLRAL